MLDARPEFTGASIGIVVSHRTIPLHVGFQILKSSRNFAQRLPLSALPIPSSQACVPI